MLLRLTIVALVPLAGCAHPATHLALRAPNPNGCYAIVYAEPAFRGAGDVLNGPAHLSGLEDVPETNEGNWRKRIRSLRVGPSAIVTVYVEAAFKGFSQRFEHETAHPRLEPALSARIQSLEVTCVDRPTPR